MSLTDGIASFTLTSASGIVTRPAQILAVGSDAMWVETRDLDLGHPSKRKYISKIVLDIATDDVLSSVYALVGWRDRMNETLEWTEQMGLSELDEALDIRQTARLWRVKIVDQSPARRWKLTAIEWYGQVLEGRV